MADRKVTVQFLGDSKQLTGELQDAEGKLDKFGGKLADVGKVAAGVGIAAGTLGVAAAGGLLKLGMSFDDAYDTIQVGTGATGKALEGLQDTFKSVFTSIPTDMGSAATAVADLNTRTGATGVTLQTLAATMLEMTRLTGGDLSTNIESVTRLMGDWGINAEDGRGAMEKLFVVSQSTGIGIDTLSNSMVQFGAPLRQLGFDFDTSAALLGKFEKEGVNAELVMGSLRIALGKMAKDGIPAQEGLQKTVDAIKNAGSASEANALALELFGARAGPDMAAAIREGRFEVDDLVASMADSEWAVQNAALATDDFGQKLTILKNKALVALEPMAAKVLDFANTFVDRAIPALEKFGEFLVANVVPAVEDAVAAIGEKFGPIVKDIAEGVQDAAPKFLEIGKNIGEVLVPAVKDAGGYLKDLFGDTWTNLVQPAVAGLQTAFETLAPIVRDIGQAFGEVATEVGDRLAGPLQTVMDIINNNKEVLTIFAAMMLGVFVPSITASTLALYKKAAAWLAVAVASAAANLPLLALVAVIALVVAGIYLLIKNWDAIVEKFPILGTVVDGVKVAFEAFVTWVTGSLVPALTGAFETVKGVITGVITWIGEHWGQISSVLEPALEAAKALVEAAFNAMKTTIETVIGVIQGIIDVFIGVFTGDWDQAWAGIKQIFESVWNGIKDFFELTIKPIFTDAIPAAVESMKSLLGLALGGLWESVFKGPFDAVISGVRGFVNGFISAVNWVITKFGVPGIPQWGGPGNGAGYLDGAGSFAPEGLAKGTDNWRGGWAWVGEQGPELVNLPQGSKVIPNRESMGLAPLASGLPGFLPGLGDLVDNLGSFLGDTFGSMGGWVGDAWETMSTGGRMFLERIGEVGVQALSQIPGISSLVQLIVNGPVWLLRKGLELMGVGTPNLSVAGVGIGGGVFGKVFDGASGFVRGIWPFADGGIVTKPTIGLIGEAGPEVVMPLPDLAKLFRDLGGTDSDFSVLELRALINRLFEATKNLPPNMAREMENRLWAVHQSVLSGQGVANETMATLIETIIDHSIVTAPSASDAGAVDYSKKWFDNRIGKYRYGQEDQNGPIIPGQPANGAPDPNAQGNSDWYNDPGYATGGYWIQQPDGSQKWVETPGFRRPRSDGAASAGARGPKRRQEAFVVHIHGDVKATDEAEAKRASEWMGFGLVASLRARGLA